MKARIVRSIALSAALTLVAAPMAHATNSLNQTTVDNGVAYLKSQQATDGHIGTPGSDTGWSAVALSAAGVNLTSVKTGSGSSLEDYLLLNPPAATDKATDWERSIIAITADGQNPYAFGGTNYVEKLKAFVSAGQIGLTTASNDDYFGVIALIAAADPISDKVINDEMTYVLAQQRADGGFSYSTDPTVGSDTNDTAAALMALQSAKNAGLGSVPVTTAISSAKSYLLGTQNSDGGFPYDPLTPVAWGGPVSDGSSTSWVLMSLTGLGLGDSAYGLKAQAYLRTLPLADGSFPSYQPGSGDVFDTAPAITALTGGTYPLHIFSGTVPPSDPASITPPVASETSTTSNTGGSVLGASTDPTASNAAVLPTVGELSNPVLLFLAFLVALSFGIGVYLHGRRKFHTHQ